MENGWERRHHARYVFRNLSVEPEGAVDHANTRSQSSQQNERDEQIKTSAGHGHCQYPHHDARDSQEQQQNGGDSTPEPVSHEAQTDIADPVEDQQVADDEPQDHLQSTDKEEEVRISLQIADQLVFVKACIANRLRGRCRSIRLDLVHLGFSRATCGSESAASAVWGRTPVDESTLWAFDTSHVGFPFRGQSGSRIEARRKVLLIAAATLILGFGTTEPAKAIL